MTAAVASLPLPLQIADPSAEARKRRREILSTQRSVLEAGNRAVVPVHSTVSQSSDPTLKRRKLNASSGSNKKAKKPQMKYDPEVPMTKEEAAVWRREQRRKRNRESAAASRQRQRDRISELEVEVEGWKTKFDVIMSKIKELETASCKSMEDYMSPEQSLAQRSLSTSKFVSPPSSPSYSPIQQVEAEPSPVTSSIVPTVKIASFEGSAKLIIGQVEPEHSDILISRPAAS